jgi:hypothetical protein
MAAERLRAKMIEMNPSSLNSSTASPRWFILLPEESVDGRGQRRVGVTAAQNARELGRLDRV